MTFFLVYMKHSFKPGSPGSRLASVKMLPIIAVEEDRAMHGSASQQSWWMGLAKALFCTSVLGLRAKKISLISCSVNIADVIISFSGSLFVVRAWMTLVLFAPGAAFKLSINKKKKVMVDIWNVFLRNPPAFVLWFRKDFSLLSVLPLKK